MTLLTDNEKKEGINEITSADGTVLLGEMDDLEYFKTKLARLVLRGATYEETQIVRKKIKLLEDTNG